MKFINAELVKTYCLQDMSKNRDTPLPVFDSGGPQIDYDAALAGMKGNLIHQDGVVKTVPDQSNTWDQDVHYENNKME